MQMTARNSAQTALTLTVSRMESILADLRKTVTPFHVYTCRLTQNSDTFPLPSLPNEAAEPQGLDGSRQEATGDHQPHSKVPVSEIRETFEHVEGAARC